MKNKKPLSFPGRAGRCCWCCRWCCKASARPGCASRHGAAVRAAGLGLNIVVGYAGLLDLGYVAFYAVGAYMYGLLASPAPDEKPSRRWPRCSRTGCTPRCGWSFRWRRAGGIVRRAAGRAHAEAARRLPGHRDAGFRRDHPRVHEQPGAPGQHHQRPQGHQPDRLASSSSALTWASRSALAASTLPRSRCTTTCSWRWWCSAW
jgi:hypothetical protein